MAETEKGPAKDASADRFDALADRYDRWYDTPVHQSIDAAEKAAIRSALPAGPRRGLLLDVGCGTGHWLLFFRMAGYKVVGLDLSAQMLRVARSKFDDIPLVRADARRLPFDDRIFDIVSCITTLEFVNGNMQTLKEMYRCLKPGGRLVVGALNAFSLLGIKRKLCGGSTFRGAHFFSTSELRHCLAGFGKPHVTTSAFGPPWKCLLPLFGFFETIGKMLFPAFGQLIVATLEKPENSSYGNIGRQAMDITKRKGGSPMADKRGGYR